MIKKAILISWLFLLATALNAMEKEKAASAGSWMSALSTFVTAKMQYFFSKNTTAEDRLRALATYMTSHRKIPSLKELALTTLVTSPTSDPENLVRQLAALPGDLHEPLKKFFIRYHAVSLLRKFTIEPQIKKIGMNVVSPNHKYLFCSEKFFSLVYGLNGTEMNVLGSVEIIPFSISHDSKNAALIKNGIVKIIALPDLQVCATIDEVPSEIVGWSSERYERIRDTISIGFDSKTNTSFVITSEARQASNGHKFQYERDEPLHYDPELYIFVPLYISHQWKDYLLVMEGDLSQLSTFIPLSTRRNIIGDYWGRVFDEYMQQNGLRKRNPRHFSWTFNNKYLAICPSQSNLIIIDKADLINFSQEKKVVTAKLDLNNEGVISPGAELCLHPSSPMMLISYLYDEYYEPRGSRMRLGFCLYDFIAKDFVRLPMAKEDNGPSIDFWFNEEEDSIIMISEKYFHSYDLKELLPSLSFEQIANYLTEKK